MDSVMDHHVFTVRTIQRRRSATLTRAKFGSLRRCSSLRCRAGFTVVEANVQSDMVYEKMRKRMKIMFDSKNSS